MLHKATFGLSSVIALALTFSANAESPDNHFNYKDLFQLEYAANPVVMPGGDAVVFERRSMDIMTDRMRRNLWTVSLDGDNMMPLLSDKANHFSPVFSKDGKKMAYLSSKEGDIQVYVRDMQSGQTARVTNLSMSPNGLSFSNDGKYLAFSMFTPQKKSPMFSLPFKPKGAKWADSPQVIDDTLFQRDGAGMNKPGNTHVYIVPAIGGTPRQISSGDYDFGGRLAWSPDDSHIIVSANLHDNAEFDVFNSDIVALNVNDQSITTLTEMTGPESSPTISPNGKLIAFTGFVDNGKSSQISELYVMNSDGSDIRSLTTELDRSVGSVQWAPNGKGLYFSYDDHGKKHVAYVTLSGKMSEKTDQLGGLSIGRPYTSGHYDVTPDNTIVYTHSTGIAPADLAVTQSRKEPLMLTELNDDVLGHKTLNAPELLSLESSVDGRALQAWIVTPPDFDPTRQYPLLLEIHGGPHTAYGPEFSAEAQLFAAAGYVVLYGNPRGSTSQGAEFANLIDKNYPSQDYNDLMDMVDAAIAKGYVDENNLFVTGGSGGGVLTAWIIGNNHRFNAAVVAKPVINWISMIGTSDIYTFMTRYWFTDLPWNDFGQYWNRSPLSLVGNVKTPTMVLTGELDVRTPMSESEQYYGALRLQGVDSALVRIQGAYHGIAAKPSNLANKVGHILAWFEKYHKTEEQE